MSLRRKASLAIRLRRLPAANTRGRVGAQQSCGLQPAAGVASLGAGRAPLRLVASLGRGRAPLRFVASLGRGRAPLRFVASLGRDVPRNWRGLLAPCTPRLLFSERVGRKQRRAAPGKTPFCPFLPAGSRDHSGQSRLAPLGHVDSAPQRATFSRSQKGRGFFPALAIVAVLHSWPHFPPCT